MFRTLFSHLTRLSDGYKWLPQLMGLTAVGAFFALLLIAGAGCRSPVAKVASQPLPALDTVRLPVAMNLIHTKDEAAQYVGDSTCGGCHPKETGSHAGTPHANGVREATVAADGAVFRQKVKLTDGEMHVDYLPELAAGSLAIRSEAGGLVQHTPMNVAIGSGEHGTTYVSLKMDGSATIPPISVFVKDKRRYWSWTPKEPQPGVEENPLGRPISAQEVSDCIGCHSTSVQVPLRLRVDRLGIGCERCHGPASAHLKAVRKNPESVRSDPRLPRLHSMTADQTLALCNTCHKPLSHTLPNGLPSDLARSQAVALRLSRCYRESKESLSCTTCHNPHARLDTEIKNYERACINCHSAPKAKLCPVNRVDGCVRCHMGKESLRIFNDTTYTNHWIRRKID